MTPSFCLRLILPKKHNHPKMLVNSLISTKFQVPDSPRVVPEAGLMKPCPQEHMRPIGSISPGAIAHDRLGSARRVTNSQLVCVSGGVQAAGMSVLQAPTQLIEHLFPYPAVYQESGRSWSRHLPESATHKWMKMAVEGSHVSDRSRRPPGRFATFDGASEPQ